ncbi:MAG: response regulator [Armatimonadetes bacterium]|nr:response regulator [Armatimonadota bacterium]
MSPSAFSQLPILIVDDDVALCELFYEILDQEGFAVETCHTGVDAVARIVSGRYRLVVLDFMLPGKSGIDILREVRTQSSTPVLMLTARGSNIDRIVGLELGADDYVSKPFDAREVVARIRAIIRRTDANVSQPDLLRLSDLSINPLSRTAYRGAEPLDLTAAEFDILSALISAPGKVVPREELSNCLGRELLPFDRSIDMHISNLRKKLGLGVDGLDRIKTVRSYGYLLAVPADPSP